MRSRGLAQSLYLMHLFPPDVILRKTRGSYTDQKCWYQGFYKVPGVLQHVQQGALERHPVEFCPTIILKVDL